MININKFVFSPFTENTYLIWDEQTKEAIIVDPGCANEDEENTLGEFIKFHKLQLTYMINTHCHIDHIFGCAFIKKKYNPKYLVPEEDLPLLKNADKQAEMFAIDLANPPEPDAYLSEKLVLTVGESKINFIFTPGHTPGEFCLFLENEKILISGDVLFNESIGRTDLWGGNYDTLISSIKTKLLTLPEDVTVYPGHGEETSIGYEKQNNPFLL